MSHTPQHRPEIGLTCVLSVCKLLPHVLQMQRLNASVSLLARQLQVAAHLRPSILLATLSDIVCSALLQKRDGIFYWYPSLNTLFGALKHMVPSLRLPMLLYGLRY